MRRLVRRDEGKWIAGVAAGLGDYTGLDPVIFRVVFILLSFAGGVGLLLYAAAWWLVPAATEAESPGERALERFRNLPSWAAVTLLVLGAVVLASALGNSNPSVIWGLLFVGLGVLLLRRDERPSSAVPAPAAGPEDAAATAPRAAVGSVPATAARPRRQQRERSRLGWFTLAALLVATGTAAILDNIGLVHLDATQYLALGVTIAGLGLIVGAWWGRAWSMVFVGLLLVPLMLAFSLVDVPLDGGTGVRDYRPPSTALIRPEYRLAGGKLLVDLSRVSFGATPVSVAASVGAGRLTVVVPRDVRVAVDGRAGAGVVDLYGDLHSGVEVHASSESGPAAASGRLSLDLAAGYGEVVVRPGGPSTGAHPPVGPGRASSHRAKEKTS